MTTPPMTTRAGREPLIRPPRLQVEREGGASRLELFFDLAYVLVVLELAKVFYADLTLHGLLVLTGLFVAIWVSWVGFTLYANRFDTDDVVFRVVKLAATAAVALCAASAGEAVGKYAVPFAASFLVGRVLLLLLHLRAWRHVRQARPTIRFYLLSVGISALLWAVSLATPGETRYWLWAAAVLVDALGPVLATLGRDSLPLHIEHLPERFGLLVIIVLGEALGGVVRGVHDASWAGSALAVGIAGLVLAASLWWVYFDVAAESSADRLEQVEEEEDETAGNIDPDPAASDERHDLFVYGHLPLALGTVLVGVSLEDLIMHRDSAEPWVLAAGLCLFLAGTTMIIAGTARSWGAVWPWPTAFVPVVVALCLLIPNALVLVVTAAAVVLLLAVHGTIASRNPGTELSGG